MSKMLPGEISSSNSYLYLVYISVSQEARAFYKNTGKSEAVLFSYRFIYYEVIASLSFLNFIYLFIYVLIYLFINLVFM